MLFSLKNTSNINFKLLKLDNKVNNKFLLNILIGSNLKNIENDNLFTLNKELKSKLNTIISNKFNSKFNKSNHEHLKILQKLLNIKLLIYDNKFNKIYNIENKMNKKVELIKNGLSYNLLIRNNKRNNNIIQRAGTITNNNIKGNPIKIYQEDTKYAEINDNIRELGPIKLNKYLENNNNDPIIKFIKILDSEINSTINTNVALRDVELYRGIPKIFITNALQNYNIINNLAYTSCSKSFDIAKKFWDTEERCCIIKFILPDDIKFLELAKKNEEEILIQRNTMFIIDIDASKGKPYYVAQLVKLNLEGLNSKQINTKKIENDFFKQISKNKSINSYYKDRLQMYIKEGEDDNTAKMLADYNTTTAYSMEEIEKYNKKVPNNKKINI